MKAIKILIIFCTLTSATFSQLANQFKDLKNPFDWHLASIPGKQVNLFPESYLQNDLTIGFNRARICWYFIDPIFQSNQPQTPVNVDDAQRQNHFIREIIFNEVYPNGPSNVSVTAMNLAYYPAEKGPYNYDVNPTNYSNGIDSIGNLNSPQLRWSGIMRTIPKNLFTTNNLHFLGFWLMDPFVYDSTNAGGNLYINIGNVSEDVLKDGKRSAEGGLPLSSTLVNVDTTVWGRLTSLTLPPDTFYDDYSIPYQDLGLEGLNNSDEGLFYTSYLNSIGAAFGTGSQAYSKANNDPSSDNYIYFLDQLYDPPGITVLDRYKRWNDIEGNSTSIGSGNLNIATNKPDDEDLNRNDILDTTENYFQFKIVLNKDSFIVGQNFITDTITVNPVTGPLPGIPVTWYKFLIPLDINLGQVIGSITSIDSSDFMRLILKDFSKEVYLRIYEMAFVTSDLTTVSSINDDSRISVYPNPNNGLFTIDNLNVGACSIKIYNMMGQVIYSSVTTGNSLMKTIDLSGVNAGIYFIEINSQNSVFKRRIVIEK